MARSVSTLVMALCLEAFCLLKGQHLPVRAFSSVQGLPGGSIEQIYRDTHGFLWICTPEGMARYDGQLFSRFGAAEGWPGERVHDLLQARDSSFWFATSQGIFRLGPIAKGAASATPIQRLSRSSPDKLSGECLLEDHQGVIWCGTRTGLFRTSAAAGGGFQQVDLRTPVGISDDRPMATMDDSPTISALAEKADGGLWAGGSGLYALEPDGRVHHFTQADGLPGPWVRSLKVAPDGTLWVATWQGIIRVRLKPRASGIEILEQYGKASGHPELVCHVLHLAQDGRVFAGTDTGVSVIAHGTVQSFERSQGLFGPVTALAEGGHGELWLGTDHGAQCWSLEGMITYRPLDRPDPRVNMIFADRTGALVTATAENKAYTLHYLKDGGLAAARRSLPPGIQLPSWAWHQSVLQDHLGAWWLATNGGLCRTEVAPSVTRLSQARYLKVYKAGQACGGKDDNVFAIYEDRHGDIWFTTLTLPVCGFGRWVRDEDRIEVFNGKDGLPKDPPLATAFTEDKARNLWVAFDKAGVARYRHGRFDFFNEAKGIPACWIRSLMTDSSGRIWLACGRGGVRVIEDPTSESPRVRAFTTEQGLAADSTWCFAEDRWGRIYVGTGAGVDRVDLEHGRVVHFSETQGLGEGIPRCGFRDADGTLWFGLNGGLSRYVPQPPRPEQTPPIYLTGLRLAGASSPLPEFGTAEWEVSPLSAQQNRIQVDFTSTGLMDGGSLRFQYRLEGVSSAWSSPSGSRSVDFANLAPGHYHFQVRAVAAEGATSTSPAELRFTIRAPVWRRWWFVSLSAGSLLGLVWLAYRFRLRQLLAVERIRTRIAADLHDDIGASLSRIAILSEVVKRQTPAEQTDTLRFLVDIADSSRGLVDTMSDIVWSIDPRRDNLKHLLARVGAFATDLAEAKGVKWTMAVPPDPSHIKLTPEQRRGVFLILKEGINNALKHSGCKSLTLHVGTDQGWIRVRLRDDGIGLPKVLPDSGSVPLLRGRGLVNMAARAKEMRARLEIQSTPEAGTTLWLEWPQRSVGGA